MLARLSCAILAVYYKTSSDIGIISKRKYSRRDTAVNISYGPSEEVGVAKTITRYRYSLPSYSFARWFYSRYPRRLRGRIWLDVRNFCPVTLQIVHWSFASWRYRQRVSKRLRMEWWLGLGDISMRYRYRDKWFCDTISRDIVGMAMFFNVFNHYDLNGTECMMSIGFNFFLPCLRRRHSEESSNSVEGFFFVLIFLLFCVQLVC